MAETLRRKRLYVTRYHLLNSDVRMGGRLHCAVRFEVKCQPLLRRVSRDNCLNTGIMVHAVGQPSLEGIHGVVLSFVHTKSDAISQRNLRREVQTLAVCCGKLQGLL